MRPARRPFWFFRRERVEGKCPAHFLQVVGDFRDYQPQAREVGVERVSATEALDGLVNRAGARVYAALRYMERGIVRSQAHCAVMLVSHKPVLPAIQIRSPLPVGRQVADPQR